MSDNSIIGIDIGGTNTRIVCALSGKKPVFYDKVVFPTTGNFQQDYKKITTYITKHAPVKSIGIGIPGKLNTDNSMVARAMYVPGYIHKPLSQLLRKTYQCQVVMENDATAAAFGEAVYGTFEKSNFLYLIWGTGIGGATVTYHNNRPTVAPINWEKYLQKWNHACGGRSLEKQYKKPPELLNAQEWQEIMNNFTQEIISFVNNLKPTKVIFGGGISIKQEKQLRERLQQLHQYLPNTHLAISSLGEEAGLYGSIRLASLSK